MNWRRNSLTRTAGDRRQDSGRSGRHVSLTATARSGGRSLICKWTVNHANGGSWLVHAVNALTHKYYCQYTNEWWTNDKTTTAFSAFCISTRCKNTEKKSSTSDNFGLRVNISDLFNPKNYKHTSNNEHKFIPLFSTYKYTHPQVL